MFKKIILAAIATASLSHADTTLSGAGASFPAPVYQKWTYDYSQANANTTVTYQSVGSGAGINQIKSGTVDFAGSDSPLTLEAQQEAELLQFPMLTGGVVVIVNLPGVKDGQLKLSRKVLSDIYLGNITKWSHPAIKACNPGMRIPGMKISVVRRADSSGTSFIFTNYLSKISSEWKEEVGQGSSVKWPVGQGGNKNPGVCNAVKTIMGAIGYTEYTYAVEAKIPVAQLENNSGKYITPTPATFAASAASADWSKSKGFYMELTNIPGDKAWPITAVTYILLRNDTPAATRAELKKYFMWCYTQGAKSASELHYIPLPASVVAEVEPKL